MNSVNRPVVNQIAGVGIVYEVGCPEKGIFLTKKDPTYPIVVFRDCVTASGGNWSGENAKQDRGPRDTFLREMGEELSFEKPVFDTGEMKELGLVDHVVQHRTKGGHAQPSPEDHAALEKIKQRIRNNAYHPFDAIWQIHERVFRGADPTWTKGGLSGLNTFFACPLERDVWEELERLQEKFGNLSNESESWILTPSALSNTRFAWGHEVLLQEFLNRMGIPTTLRSDIGVDVQILPPASESYQDYLAMYEVLKHP